MARRSRVTFSVSSRIRPKRLSVRLVCVNTNNVVLFFPLPPPFVAANLPPTAGERTRRRELPNFAREGKETDTPAVCNHNGAASFLNFPRPDGRVPRLRIATRRPGRFSGSLTFARGIALGLFDVTTIARETEQLPIVRV